MLFLEEIYKDLYINKNSNLNYKYIKLFFIKSWREKDAI